MEEQKNTKLQLHYWYVNEISYKGKVCRIAHGRVSGHERLEDATFVHTSIIRNIEIDKVASEAIIKTQNSEYHCPLEYCKWSEQDKTASCLPEYEWIKNNYKGKNNDPSIDEGKVLLVLSNFDDYYFNSLYYKPIDATEKVAYCAYPHIGMFQDSFLIFCDKATIDIRYFPYYQSIEFYMLETKGTPVFIENIGDIVLYAKTNIGVIRLEPGDRKEVSEENVC